MTTESLEGLRDRLLREERVQRMIRLRAYEIYQMRGNQTGGEAHDWFQAESEVLAFLIATESGRGDQDEKPTSRIETPRTVSPASKTPVQPGKPRSRAPAKAAKVKQPAPAKAVSKKAPTPKPARSNAKPKGAGKQSKTERPPR
ncbi:MAG: DUF2934 domain-containing protein [Blastocatellia bacterium]